MGGPGIGVVPLLPYMSRFIGEYEAFWDKTKNNGNRLNSGTYSFHLKPGKQLVTKKIVALL